MTGATAHVSSELLIVLGYFPARRPCVRRFSRRSSLPWAVATAKQWLLEGAERVQVQRHSGAAVRVVLEGRGEGLLIVHTDAPLRRFSVSW